MLTTVMGSMIDILQNDHNQVISFNTKQILHNSMIFMKMIIFFKFD